MPLSTASDGPLQTRRRARLCTGGEQQQLPSIPTPVQLAILDYALDSHTEPDRIDYALWPYKSTLGWLLSLRLVCKQWNAHVEQHPACIRRCRLAALRNLSLQHDYAHIIVTSRCSKRRRVKAVPLKLTLKFEDSSSTAVAIPKHLPKVEVHRGLPLNTLMLVAAYCDLTIKAFLRLLADIDCLDQHHAAPMVLKITRPSASAAKSPSSRSKSNTDSVQAQQPAHGSCSAAVCQEAADAYPAPVQQYATSLQQLADAARPVLQNSLQHVVMEQTAASTALYFIPTKRGFCRRVPMI